mgnify:CR=1 FL=1
MPRVALACTLAGIDGGAQDLAEELVGAPHGGRSQSLPRRVGDPSANLVLGDRNQRHRPEAGEDVEPEQPLVSGLGVGTKLHRGPTPQGVPVPELHAAQRRVGPGTPQLVVLNPGEEPLDVVAPILSCEHLWCQGFSEPDAGSGSSALRARRLMVAAW